MVEDVDGIRFNVFGLVEDVMVLAGFAEQAGVAHAGPVTPPYPAPVSRPSEIHYDRSGLSPALWQLQQVADADIWLLWQQLQIEAAKLGESDELGLSSWDHELGLNRWNRYRYIDLDSEVKDLLDWFDDSWLGLQRSGSPVACAAERMRKRSPTESDALDRCERLIGLVSFFAVANEIERVNMRRAALAGLDMRLRAASEHDDVPAETVRRLEGLAGYEIDLREQLAWVARGLQLPSPYGRVLDVWLDSELPRAREKARRELQEALAASPDSGAIANAAGRLDRLDATSQVCLHLFYAVLEQRIDLARRLEEVRRLRRPETLATHLPCRCTPTARPWFFLLVTSLDGGGRREVFAAATGGRSMTPSSGCVRFALAVIVWCRRL